MQQNSKPKAQLSQDEQFLYSTVFKQVQGCGDIISAILLISKFVSENSVPVQFDVTKLRQIALRSMDKDTSTCLWHINALIAAAADFEHLLLGLEMMFERFLGSAQLFLKEKVEQKAQSARDTKFLGNEIVSFVNSYYEDSPNQEKEKQNAKAGNAGKLGKAEKKHTTDDAKISVTTTANDYSTPPNANIIVTTENIMTTPIRHRSADQGTKGMKGRTTIQCEWLNDENADANVIGQGLEKGDALQEYRGKISSPISFRLRQQKRMMQSERGSRTSTASTSFLNFQQQNNLGSVAASVDCSLLDDMHLMETQPRVSMEPEVASPFDVNKFAQSVDMYENTLEHARQSGMY